MNNIKWKDGAVCYADGKQWFVNKSGKHNKPLISERNRDFASFEWLIFRGEPSINEIRQGDYIEASELDTEQKYNDAIEVFCLFGFELCDNTNGFKWFKGDYTYRIGSLVATKPKLIGVRSDYSFLECQRKLTYQQLMTIGKLKRAMIDFEKFNRSDIPQNEKRNKSKQAYEILKSLDYDYDLDKQQWFKKEYI